MDKEQGNQLNLTVVALVALVAIVGLVALVMNAASVKQITTGSGLVQAASTSNVAGNARLQLTSPPVTSPPTKIVYTGNLVLQGQSYHLEFDAVKKNLAIAFPDGTIQTVTMTSFGQNVYAGSWIVAGQIIPVTLDMTTLNVKFTFTNTVTAVLS